MTRVADDDDAEIEAEIRRELERLGDDSLELKDLEDDESPLIADQVSWDLLNLFDFKTWNKTLGLLSYSLMVKHSFCLTEQDCWGFSAFLNLPI